MSSGKLSVMPTSSQAVPVAFLYRDGVMNDLNSFLPIGSGWSLLYAKGINDQDEIVGQGYNPAGLPHAFFMDTPR